MSTPATRSAGAHRRTYTATSSSLKEQYWEDHRADVDDSNSDSEHVALTRSAPESQSSASRHAPIKSRIRIRTWAEMATQPDASSSRRTVKSISPRLVILWGAISVVALLLGGSVLLALVDISVDGLGTYASSSITGLASLLISPESDVAPWTVEPAMSFAPRVPVSAANAPYFLLDKQHRNWESERDLSWKQIGFWELARGPNRINVRKALEKEETCLTYEARYEPYSNSTADSVSLPPTAGAKTALLMHLYHKVFQPPMSPDMLRHLRAAITEVQLGSGIDVFLSIHLGHHADAAFREEVMQNVPSDLRGRVLAFDSQELFGRYVSDQNKIDKLIRVGGLPCENHYTASYFLDSAQGQQYSHMWWIESDVRQTGSWASFFNHLNATIPVQRPPPKRWQRPYEGVFAEEWDSAVRGPWQPDYFATRFLDGSDTAGDWDGRGHQAKHVFGSDIAKAFIHMWGMSRRFHEVLTDYLVEGEVADSEYVLSSVAKKHGIPMWHSEPPVYRNGKVGNGYPTFGGYRPAGANPYYRAWHDNSTMCRPGPTLLHAVKAWKKQPGF